MIAAIFADLEAAADAIRAHALAAAPLVDDGAPISFAVEAMYAARTGASVAGDRQARSSQPRARRFSRQAALAARGAR